MGTANLQNRFIEYIEAEHLVLPGQRILVAVSGGPDSVVLLHLLHTVIHLYNGSLAVAHLNHNLRDEESLRDQEFVGNLAKNLGLECVIGNATVQEYADTERLSIEEAARIKRYSFLESARKSTESDSIATGHNKNDQAETVLMNLARGAGIRGAGGMRPRRGNIIRPLLFAMRDEIESYAGEHRIPYVTDSSNLEHEYTRNRFRYTVIPAMEQASGHSVVDAVVRNAGINRKALDFLSHERDRAYSACVRCGENDEIVLDIHGFITYFRIVQELVLVKLLEECFPQKHGIGSALIDRLIYQIHSGKKGSVTEIGTSARAYKFDTHVAFVENYEPLTEIPVEAGCTVTIPGTRYALSLLELHTAEPVFSQNPMVEFTDYSTIKGGLALRGPKPGDRFVPVGMMRSKKLKDFFIDEKVPVYRRSQVPVLTDSTKIVWVCGMRLDNRCAVTENTTRVLRLELLQKK